MSEFFDDNIFYRNVFKNVTAEILDKTRERWIEEGKLKTLRTPFGNLDILIHEDLNDDEIYLIENDNSVTKIKVGNE